MMETNREKTKRSPDIVRFKVNADLVITVDNSVDMIQMMRTQMSHSLGRLGCLCGPSTQSFIAVELKGEKLGDTLLKQGCVFFFNRLSAAE